jgi:hypothetical protein
MLSKSISSGTQYATLQKYFSSHPSLVIYFFPTTKKEKKVGNEQSNGMNQKQGVAVISYLLHSSLVGVKLCLFHLPGLTTCAKMLGQTLSELL